MKISGYTVCRNAIKLDYTVRETVESMLPVCDEVVVCDSDSDDGTREMLNALASVDSRIRVINWPWPNPHAQWEFFREWLNYTREHLSHPIQLELDSDEILDDRPEAYSAIRDAAVSANPRRLCQRLNFWKHNGFICQVPEGNLVGTMVARIGESSAYMCSDEISTGRATIRDGAVPDERIQIFHVGFLRKPEAFFAKARVMLGAFHGTYDDRLVRCEQANAPQWDCEDLTFRDLLTPYCGHYPQIVAKWLREHGHSLEHP